MNRLFQEMQQNNKFFQFMRNPIGFLMQSKFQIPQEYQNDPKRVADYLVQSGQVNQDTCNWAMRTAQSMGIKLK